MVADAVADYPSLLADRAEVMALRARTDQVSQPRDPILTAGLMNLPWDSLAFDEQAMTGVQIGVRQRFYWPGTLDARVDSAEAEATAREAHTCHVQDQRGSSGVN